MKKLLLSMVAILFAINAYAQPSTITYQGVLTDANGATVTETPNITFSLFDSETNGTQLWTETHNNVQVANGLFQVELNSIANNWGTANFATNMWLQITVAATTLSPRVKFNASGYALATAGITDVGSGKIITDEERQRWNDAIPDTIRHPENDVYLGGLIASYPTALVVNQDGLVTSEKKHVLVFKVPSNGVIEQRFSYINILNTASGLVVSLEDQKRMLVSKVFDYTTKPYEKSYKIIIDVFNGANLLQHVEVSPNNPVVTNSNGHTIIVKLVSESTVSIMLDQIGQPDIFETKNFETYINQSTGYIPSANVENFSGDRTTINIQVKNQGNYQADYIVAIRNCSQNMNIPELPKLRLSAGEEKAIAVNLFFPKLSSFTGAMSLWVDLLSPDGTLYDSVQVIFEKTSQ